MIVVLLVFKAYFKAQLENTNNIYLAINIYMIAENDTTIFHHVAIIIFIKRVISNKIIGFVNIC